MNDPTTTTPPRLNGRKRKRSQDPQEKNSPEKVPEAENRENKGESIGENEGGRGEENQQNEENDGDQYQPMECLPHFFS